MIRCRETKRARVPALAAKIKAPRGVLLLFAVFQLVFAALFSGQAMAATPILGDILHKMESMYQQSQAYSGTFRQTTKSSAAGTITPGEAVGTVYYARPRQMRWEYDKPEVQVFVANNDHAWLYLPSENQVSLFDAKSLFGSPLAQTFFDGAVGLRNHFDVSLDATQSTRSTAVLKLVPKEEDPNIQFLYIWVDLQTYRITRIDSQDLLGNTNRIVLDSLKATPGLDPRLFHLEVPQGTRVFDAEGRELRHVEIEDLKSRIAAGKP